MASAISGAAPFSASEFIRKGEADRPWRKRGGGTPVERAARRRQPRQQLQQLQPLTSERSQQLQAYLTAQLSGISVSDTDILSALEPGPLPRSRPGSVGRPSSRGSSIGEQDHVPAATASTVHAQAPRRGSAAPSVQGSLLLAAVPTVERWPARMSSTEGDRRGHITRDRDPLTPDLDRPGTADTSSSRGTFRHNPARALPGSQLPPDGNMRTEEGNITGQQQSRRDGNSSSSGSAKGLPRVAAPQLLVDLEGFVNRELNLRGVAGPEHTGHLARLAIFSECFEAFVKHCTTYQPL